MQQVVFIKLHHTYQCTINSRYLERVISIFLVTFYDEDMVSFLLRCSNIFGAYYMPFFMYMLCREMNVFYKMDWKKMRRELEYVFRFKAMSIVQQSEEEMHASSGTHAHDRGLLFYPTWHDHGNNILILLRSAPNLCQRAVPHLYTTNEKPLRYFPNFIDHC